MYAAILNLWWLWLILSIWLPPMLFIAVPTTAIVFVRTFFDTSELTIEGLRGKKVKRDMKQIIKNIFNI